MKTLRAILLAMLALAVVTATGWAKFPKSYVIGSAHDLTAGTWSGATSPSTSSVCYFCHIIHKTSSGAITTAPGAYLWNHTLNTTTTSYGVYSSDSFNTLMTAAGTSIADLGSATVSSWNVSNLCLSCHDGTIALASFYATGPSGSLPASGATFTPTGGTAITNLAGTSFQIADLTRSHPVHFPYTAALATAYGAGLTSPVSTHAVDSAGEIPLFATNAQAPGVIAGGLLECATCHDPHNGQGTGTVAAATAYGFPFSRNFGTVTGSFCSACHE